MEGKFEDDPRYWISDEDIFGLNDDKGRNAASHRRVLKMFDLAISLAKKAARKNPRAAYS